MSVPVLESCPVCRGTNEIKSSMKLIDDIENNLNYLIQDQNEKKMTLHVHPFVSAYLTQGILHSPQKRWYKKYGRWVKVKAEKEYHLMEYKFFNRNNDEIKN